MAIDLYQELARVRNDILALACKVQQQVDDAIASMVNKDIALARQVRAGDAQVNSLELDVESECLRILALSHPVASDLRFVMAVLRINTDLERIGDKAKSIAKRVIDLIDCSPIAVPPQLIEMAEHTRAMLRDALTALAEEDASLCRRVRLADDSVDMLQKELFTWAHTEIPRNVVNTQAVIDMLSISRAIERIADLSTDIADDVIFLVEGSIVRHRKT